jgi:predicted RNA-binding protein (virulence factor B family)
MHIALGKFNILEVTKSVNFGLYLDGGNDGEILLPKRYAPDDCMLGDFLNVFVYLDSEERLVATTQTPLAQVGEFAYLEVAWVNEYGAFLNWGLMKDLFVPFREQTVKMQVGHKYVVYVYVDEKSYRIVASAGIDRYLSKEPSPYQVGDEVDILIFRRTDLGFNAVIENRFVGLLYEKEVFRPLQTGMKLTAYIKQVREDHKIDLTLQKTGVANIKDFSDTLLQYLKDNGGTALFNDKSQAEDIYRAFGVSKKTFKKAIGDLYRKRLIVLDNNRLFLSE